MNLVKATLSRIFHSCLSIPLFLHPPLSPSLRSLSPCISHFARRCENQYFLATSASRLEVGIEKGTLSAHSFINIYPHLNPSETESSAPLLRPSLLPVLVHGLSPVFEAKLPGVYLFLQIFYTFPTRICIHNCHGRPEPALSSRLYFSSHSFPRSPFVPLLFSLFVMTRPKFSSILSPFLAFFFFWIKRNRRAHTLLSLAIVFSVVFFFFFFN